MAASRAFLVGSSLAVVLAWASGAHADPVIEGRITGGKLLYKRCASAPCVPTEQDGVVALPAAAQEAGAQNAVQTLSVGSGAQILWAHGPGFDALVGARPGAEPRVLFAGPTGLVAGETGERHGDSIQISEPGSDGTVQVLLGETREDFGLCGRPAILSPKVLNPKDLAWKSATVQRLSAAERAAAETIVARRHEGASAPPLARVLRGNVASSAVGSPGALTDGDLETTWAENRGGDGHGEFAQMNAPSDVEITGIGIVVRPPSRAIPHGVGPRKVWLAADGKLYAVTFPEDPWQHAGASYDVAFKTPLKTSCLAIVLDEAFLRNERKEAEVTIAEVTASTAFDGASDLAGLVGALAGGGQRARMAAALLTRGGEPAFSATAAGYDKLDDAGRVLALEVLDGAPCSISAAVYTHAMLHGFPGESHHAETRLARCGKDAIAPLSLALESGPDKQRGAAAQELSLVAPPVAIDKITEVLAGGSRSLRRELRSALATAAKSERASDALRAKLSADGVPTPVLLDLLRASADRPEVKKEAGVAFARLATPAADFPTRYLLAGPAAHLSKQGDARAQAFLENAVRSDQDPHVRARAAEALGDVPSPKPCWRTPRELGRRRAAGTRCLAVVASTCALDTRHDPARRRAARGRSLDLRAGTRGGIPWRGTGGQGRR